MQQRLRKFIRQPEQLESRQLTDKSLELIAAIERYRFLPSSLLVRLVPGGQRNNYRHLQTLFHRGLVSRFALPKYGGPGEFVYYLDSAESLRLVTSAGTIRPSPAELARKEQVIRRNREKDYARIHRDPDVQGTLLFIQHELMISRFHAMLEFGCRALGTVDLIDFRQGPELHGSIEVPKTQYDEYGRLLELPEHERLPHRPDAFFTLRFRNRPADEQVASFFYEADRGTETTRRFRTKLRAYWHFVVKHRRHRLQPYSVQNIRAVLIESTDMHWAHNLREAAKHPVVSSRPSPLFWFTTSELFTRPADSGSNRPLPVFLTDPSCAFKRVWASPAADQFLSLLD